MREVTLQEKEDFLKIMYSVRRKENRIIKSDIICRLKVSPQRAAKVIDKLAEEGCLWKDKDKHMYLTQIGIHKGKQCLERHRDITTLLRLVAGAGPELAEKKACEIEHILGDEICLGIHTFVERRHLYSYTTKGNDLNVLFPYGKRMMPCAVYEKGTEAPRILAREHEIFVKRAEVEIGDRSYLYLRPEENACEKKELAYRAEETWIFAEKEKRGFQIPTKALECHIRQAALVSEGKIEIVLLDNREQPILEEKIRILSLALI